VDTEKSFKILIVEDDHVLGVLLERTLNNSGFMTRWVHNRTEALDFCRKQSPEETFLLLNHKFSDMTAEEIIMRLEKQEQLFPYTLLSSPSDTKSPVELVEPESTERKHSLESLTQVLTVALERTQRMLYTTHHAIMSADYAIVIAEMSDTNCPIIYHNLAFEKITGYHCSGNPTLTEWLDSYDPGQPGFDKIRTAVHDQKSIHLQLKGQDESIGWHDIMLSFIPDVPEQKPLEQAVSERKGICIGIVTNTTEQYLTSQKINSFRQQLEQSQHITIATHALKELAHEIGRPLTHMSSKIQFMLNKDTIEKKDLQSILSHIDQMTKLLKSYSEGSHETLSPTLVSIPSLLEHIVSLCPSRYDISISVDASEDLPEILVDMSKIAQVLLNLVNNAIDACASGGTIALCANITTPAEKNEEYMAISVQDTGCGIEPDHLEKLFTPFYTTKSTYPNRGLGLSICRHLAKLHDGWLTVESQPGKGTCFTLMLPLSLVCAGAGTDARDEFNK
jgi:signal transduction histidine kinase/CheY-like chemotaxis protein